VKVVDEAQVGHQSDHRAGVDDDGVAPRPSSSSLSVGVADETKVQYNTISFIIFWTDTVPLPLQYRQVRNEVAIEKIIRQRSIDGRSQFQRSLATLYHFEYFFPKSNMN
jgi:hypothetical protein